MDYIKKCKNVLFTGNKTSNDHTTDLKKRTNFDSKNIKTDEPRLDDFTIVSELDEMEEFFKLNLENGLKINGKKLNEIPKTIANTIKESFQNNSSNEKKTKAILNDIKGKCEKIFPQDMQSIFSEKKLMTEIVDEYLINKKDEKILLEKLTTLMYKEKNLNEILDKYFPLHEKPISYITTIKDLLDDLFIKDLENIEINLETEEHKVNIICTIKRKKSEKEEKYIITKYGRFFPL